MSRQDMADALLSLLAGDVELHERLFESGLLPRAPAELQAEHLETARVVRTLVHELEVNWPGVEVILHMRSELVATRRQVAELAELLRSLRTREGR